MRQLTKLRNGFRNMTSVDFVYGLDFVDQSQLQESACRRGKIADFTWGGPGHETNPLLCGTISLSRLGRADTGSVSPAAVSYQRQVRSAHVGRKLAKDVPNLLPGLFAVHGLSAGLDSLLQSPRSACGPPPQLSQSHDM